MCDTKGVLHVCQRCIVKNSIFFVVSFRLVLALVLLNCVIFNRVRISWTSAKNCIIFVNIEPLLTFFFMD